MQRVRGWSVAACLAVSGCAMSVAPPATQPGAKEVAATVATGVVLPETEALRVHDPAGRNYPIWVALPADYAAHPEKHYPVLYVTDALYSFPLVRSVRNLVGQQGVNIENFILVGLPPRRLTSKQSRSRDYTPSTRRVRSMATTATTSPTAGPRTTAISWRRRCCRWSMRATAPIPPAACSPATPMARCSAPMC